MTFWRAAGLTYLRYSTISAQTIRKALKSDKKADIATRSASTIKKLYQKST